MAKALIFDYGGTLNTNALYWSHVLWEAYQAVSTSLEAARELAAVSWEDFRAAYVFAERIYERTVHSSSFCVYFHFFKKDSCFS